MKRISNPSFLIDLHSHILPGVDDGCRTTEDSMQALYDSYEQGIRYLACTPHYYPRETVRAFLERRHASIVRLWEKQKASDRPTPQLFYGAEVAYRQGIAREPELQKLTYGSGRSPYILMELPFQEWESHVIRDLDEIISVRGLTPVIAHMERYRDFQSRAMLKELYSMPILIQMNSEALKDRKNLKTIKNGQIQLLGSDTHNLTDRAQNMKFAADMLIGKGLSEELCEMMKNAMNIVRKSAGK